MRHSELKEENQKRKDINEIKGGNMKKIFIITAILICAFLLRMDNALAAKYRLEIDVSFDNEQDAIDLLNFIEDVKAKAYKPTLTEKIPVHRKTRYHKCTHDDPVPVQCKDYIYVDFDKEKKVHKLKGVPE